MKNCGPRRARPLRYEIAVALVAKIVALIVLYAAFFSSAPRVPGISERLFNDGAAAAPAAAPQGRE